MSTRPALPNTLNSLSTTILVTESFAVNTVDVGTVVLDVQAANITVTLPQNPQVGVTNIVIMAEQQFFLSGGALAPLSPADPIPCGANSTFVVSFTATGWQIQTYPASILGPNGTIYGSGADGSVTFDGSATPIPGASRVGNVYTLTRDTNYINATVNAGITVIQGGWRLQGTGRLLNNGTIHNGGSAGALGVAGAGAPGNSLAGGTNGGAGSVNAAGVAATNQAATTRNVGGIGGAGGSNGGANAGGAAGTQQAAATTVGTFADLIGMKTNTLMLGSTQSQFQLGMGTGGGGGGSSAAGQGGGGGGGGGCCGIFFFLIINNGTIHANGGAGAAGTTANPSGGGGGGGGGAVFVLTLVTFGTPAAPSLPGTGSVSATGGAGGAPASTGVAGTAGTAGNITILAA
jgi:hypothetical protein